MHVCFIITRGDLIGGAQIHVRDMSIALMKEEHRTTAVVGTEGDFTDQLSLHGIEWFHLPSLIRKISPATDLRAFLKLRRLIKRINPDLVSTHTAKAGMLGRLAAYTSGYKSIFTAHGWQFADGIPGKQALPVILVEKVVSAMCKKIITVSEYDYNLAVRKHVVARYKMEVIHNRLPWRMPYARTVPESSSPVKLLMVARFQPQKDHPTLFKALAALQDLSWSLTLVGDGPDMEMMKDLASSLGVLDRITFLGQRRDVPEIMEQSDIYLLISHWEGFPRSIIEAMRAGLPVIASNAGGSNEAVINGETGLVVEKRDVTAVASSIRTLIGDPALRSEMGKAGRSRYEESFTFDVMYQKTVEIYGGIVN